MKKITVAAALIDCLRQEGIGTVFGLPGSQILSLIDEIYRSHDMEFITTRHEQGASFGAFGYAAARRAPGVCLSTLGPGATNLLTGVAAAFKGSVPVIALTAKGALHLHQKDAFQEINEVDIFRPVTKWSYMLTHADEAPSIMRKAFRVTLSGRPGPVHISLPSNLLSTEIDYAPVRPERYRPLWDQPFAAFSESMSQELAGLLAQARTPVIMAGEEIRFDGAEDSLQGLAELWNVPVVTALHFSDVMKADHPLYMGPVSADGWQCADRTLQTADLVLAVGVHLDFLTTKFRPSFIGDETTLIHVSKDPERIGCVYPVDMGITAGASTFLAGVENLVRDEGLRQAERPELALWKAQWLETRNAWGKMTDTPIKPQFIAYTVRTSVPARTALVSEGGNFIKFVRACTDPDGPLSFFVAEDYGAVGSGFPIAMGVKAADPSRPVVALLGDGGFMLDSGDFETAVRSNLALVGVIFNDSGFGNIRTYQKNTYGGRYACDFTNPDFAQFARLCGGWGARVERPDELEGALMEAFSRNVPSLIDVTTDPCELGDALHAPASR